MSRFSLLVVALAIASLAGCAGLRGQSRSSGSGGARDCASCERMCEVAGEARDNPGAVDRCKADCKKKCG